MVRRVCEHLKCFSSDTSVCERLVMSLHSISTGSGLTGTLSRTFFFWAHSLLPSLTLLSTQHLLISQPPLSAVIPKSCFVFFVFFASAHVYLICFWKDAELFFMMGDGPVWGLGNCCLALAIMFRGLMSLGGDVIILETLEASVRKSTGFCWLVTSAVLSGC